MYIQRCKHGPKHTHIQTLRHMLMYVEVSSITVCHIVTNMFHTQTPDVVRVVGGRPWRTFFFFQVFGGTCSRSYTSKGIEEGDSLA